MKKFDLVVSKTVEGVKVKLFDFLASEYEGKPFFACCSVECDQKYVGTLFCADVIDILTGKKKKKALLPSIADTRKRTVLDKVRKHFSVPLLERLMFS